MSRPEPTLGNPKNTIEILQKYKFVFQKKFGQNPVFGTCGQRRGSGGDRPCTDSNSERYLISL